MNANSTFPTQARKNVSLTKTGCILSSFPQRLAPLLAACGCAVLWTMACPITSLGNVIFVTKTNDVIDGMEGCSLSEAIYASRLRASLAITHSALTGATTLIVTQCMPGSGDDTIVLPTGGTLTLNAAGRAEAKIPDDSNISGPTATPQITTTITLEGFGATLRFQNCVDNLCSSRAFSVASGGHLTVLDTTITGFHATGGSGGDGAGGGKGAGGAIYVQPGGSLLVENCTFSGNSAVGGSGSGPFQPNSGGGGGEESAAPAVTAALAAIGEGGSADPFSASDLGIGAGGGGTLTDGGFPPIPGISCGGAGGNGGFNSLASAGSDATCPGGGGGGGGNGLAAGVGSDDVSALSEARFQEKSVREHGDPARVR